jgi:hypothetical protein
LPVHHSLRLENSIGLADRSGVDPVELGAVFGSGERLASGELASVDLLAQVFGQAECTHPRGGRGIWHMAFWPDARAASSFQPALLNSLSDSFMDSTGADAPRGGQGAHGRQFGVLGLPGQLVELLKRFRTADRHGTIIHLM